MQRTDFRSESPLKAFFSIPVVLSLLAMVTFYYSAAPDRTPLSGTEPGKSAQDSVDVLNKARKLIPWKLMEKRSLRDAVLAVQVMLERNPNDVASAYCAAMVFKSSNCGGEACVQMKRALSLAPNNRELRLEFARMLQDLNRLDDAIVQYGLVIKQAPKLTGPRMELAQLYLNTDRPAECARELEDLLNVAPNDIMAHKIRGIALARSGKAQEGMEEYLAGVVSEHGAGQSEAVKFILGAWGDMDKAKYELEQQAEHNPDDAMSRLRLAEIALYANRPGEAKTYLLEARKIAPKDPEIHRSLCIAYKRLGDNGQALTSFMHSVSLELEQSKKSQKSPSR